MFLCRYDLKQNAAVIMTQSHEYKVENKSFSSNVGERPNEEIKYKLSEVIVIQSFIHIHGRIPVCHAYALNE